jgi:hypothetical protein
VILAPTLAQVPVRLPVVGAFLDHFSAKHKKTPSRSRAYAGTVNFIVGPPHLIFFGLRVAFSMVCFLVLYLIGYEMNNRSFAISSAVVQYDYFLNVASIVCT